MELKRNRIWDNFVMSQERQILQRNSLNSQSKNSVNTELKRNQIWDKFVMSEKRKILQRNSHPSQLEISANTELKRNPIWSKFVMPQKRKILRLWHARNWNGTRFEMNSLCQRNGRSGNRTLQIPSSKTLSTRNWNGMRLEVNSICHRAAGRSLGLGGMRVA